MATQKGRFLHKTVSLESTAMCSTQETTSHIYPAHFDRKIQISKFSEVAELQKTIIYSCGEA